MSVAPPLSVVMAVHNGGRHLEHALDDIAAQTSPDFELIVINDGSSDGTGETLRARAATDQRLRVFDQPRLGLAAALNRGLAAASAPLVARHDADDRSRCDRFMRQLDYLAAHPDVSVVGTSAEAIDDEDRTVGTMSAPTGPATVKRALLTLRATPVHGSVMFRKAAIEAAGGYRAAFSASQDLDLWLRVAETSAIDNLAEPLYRWRLHEDGVFATRRATQLMYAGIAIVFSRERAALGADSYELLQACNGDLQRFSQQYRRRGNLEQWWGELLFRGLDDPGAARPHLRAALAAGQVSPRTVGLYGWSLLGLRWPGGATLQAPGSRS